MDELRTYWKQYKTDMCLEPKITRVYEHYEATVKTPINKYRFREFIRKNGYCNSCTAEKKCKKCMKALVAAESYSC